MFLYPFVIVCGTVFNSISFCVFRQPELKKSTTAFLFMVLSVVDTLPLYVKAFIQFLETVTRIYLSASTELTCKLYSYIVSIANAYSGWVLLVITCDRVISMAKPFLVKSLCTKKNASIVLLVSLVCICSCYIPNLIDVYRFVYMIFDKKSVTFTIVISCRNPSLILTWMHLFIKCMIPFVLMFLGNIVIIVLLYKVTKARKSMIHNASNNDNSNMDKLVNLAVLLLVTSFTYLFLTLPYNVYTFYNDTKKLPYDSGELFSTCSCFFEYINNSLNFILYCTSGQHFRGVFLRMMGWNQCCCFVTHNSTKMVARNKPQDRQV